MTEISPLYSALLIGMILANCIAWLAEAEYRDRTFMKLFWKWWGFRSAEKYVVALFLMLNLVWGATKTNENDSVIGPPGEEQYMDGGMLFEGGASMMAGETTRLTTNQCAAGLALVSVTNGVSWLTVPTNAVVYAPWTCYGAATDTFWLPATNWGFILGSNAVEGVHVASDGMLAFGWPKGSPRAAGMPDGTPVSFLAPLQGSLNIVPPEGRFWCAPTDSNSVLFTWQDAFAGSGADSRVTFQAELFWNGDFTYRYAFTNALALTNFVVGAQHNGGGETYALSDTNLLVNGLELHWRAIGVLDPGVDDHDGDGVSTYDEVMTWGTDPRLTDSDFDGLSDTVELAELSITTATNPDSDGDGLADGTDAEPRTPNNADADADQDGYPLWQELFYGTSDAVNGDVAQKFTSGYREVAFTVSGAVPSSAVLDIGGFPVPLAGRSGFSLKFTPDTVAALRLANAAGVHVGVTSQSCIALPGATGGLMDGGHGSGTASLVIVVVELGSGGTFCLHAGETNLTARVTADLPGYCFWHLSGTSQTWTGVSIDQQDVPSGLYHIWFSPYDGIGTVSCSVSFSRCKRGGFCEHGLPWGECGACLHDDFWCYAHASPKPLCPCLTVSGGTQGALPPGAGLTRSFRVGDEEDTNAPWETPCCACLEHVTLGLPDTKTNIVREVSQKLRLWRNADRTGEVTVGTRLEGPTVLYVSAAGLSVTFGDACAYFSHELHPETQYWKPVEFTVAAVGLGPDSLSAAGRYLIRGGGVCTARVSVVTDSDLTAGSVGLTTGGGLFFSETPGAPAASALRGQTNGPPGTVTGPRNFYLGATNGGLHTLTYELLDPSGSACLSTNLAVEAVVAKPATNAYYVAYGSTALLGVDLDPVSHDPAGFKLYLDSSLCATGQPPWQVDTSCLTGGVHTLTVQSGTFPDLEDSAVLNVVKIEMIEDETTIYNFSPSLGETAHVKATVIPAPPSGGLTGFHFKMEIIRELEGSGEQNIDWLVVTDEPEYGWTRPVDFSSMAFAWDGIPDFFGSSASQATGCEVFTGLVANVSRVLPAVTLDQPVPPPLYTAVATIRRNSDGTVMCEARKRIFVPQVVKLVYDGDAVTRLMEGISSTLTNTPVLMYPMTTTQWLEQTNRIKVLAQAYYDAIQANVRFCDDTVTVSPPYSTVRMNATETGVLGHAPTDYLNTNPNDEGSLLAFGFVDAVIAFFEGDPNSAPPVTPTEMGNLWGLTVAHETGHMLGLVAPGQVLDGDDWHNKNPTPRRVMNDGQADAMSDNLGRQGSWSWRLLNANYLKFILPKE